jgi:hypothetical protein
VKTEGETREARCKDRNEETGEELGRRGERGGGFVHQELATDLELALHEYEAMKARYAEILAFGTIGPRRAGTLLLVLENDARHKWRGSSSQ